MTRKFVVYTALFGDYDDLIDPKENFQGCDFICFTDQKNIQSDIWDIRIVEKCELSPNMMNRMYKWLPHKFLKNYESSQYVDSNVELLDNPLELVEKYLNNHLIAIPRHCLRNCIYKEAEGCIERNKTKIKDTMKQMKFYKSENFPKNYGLGANNIIFRKHFDNDVINIMENTWKEVNKWDTKRDQLSFFYIVWKYNFTNIVLMDENIRNNNKFFTLHPHKRFKNKNLIEKIIVRLFYLKKRILDKNLYKLITRVN